MTQQAPQWDDNGEPMTLSAAALDALQWLQWMREYLEGEKSMALDQARANLARCAGALHRKIHDTIQDESPAGGVFVVEDFSPSNAKDLARRAQDSE
jgi:hypothetical protein